MAENIIADKKRDLVISEYMFSKHSRKSEENSMENISFVKSDKNRLGINVNLQRIDTIHGDNALEGQSEKTEEFSNEAILTIKPPKKSLALNINLQQIDTIQGDTITEMFESSEFVIKDLEYCNDKNIEFQEP